jgi:hypothetical protein
MTDILEETKRKWSRRRTRQEQIEKAKSALVQLGLLDEADALCESKLLELQEDLPQSNDGGRLSQNTAVDPAIAHWASIAENIRRIADHLTPLPPAKVGTPYIAQKLGCTTVWVTEMTRTGEIPWNCIVQGTGNGKPWKFHRDAIDRWIKSRGPTTTQPFKGFE